MLTKIWSAAKELKKGHSVFSRNTHTHNGVSTVVLGWSSRSSSSSSRWVMRCARDKRGEGGEGGEKERNKRGNEGKKKRFESFEVIGMETNTMTSIGWNGTVDVMMDLLLL